MNRIKSMSPNGATLYDHVNETYYMSDGLHLYFWDEGLKDWVDSDYTENDTFYNCLIQL